MSELIRSGYCKECDKRVKLQTRGRNHILHSLLSMMAFGVWNPVMDTSRNHYARVEMFGV